MENTYKVFLMGPLDAGKTSLITCYLKGYNQGIMQSNLYACNISHPDIAQPLKCHIWDTAGIFGSLPRELYRLADAAIVVYDVLKPEPLAVLKQLLGEVRTHGRKEVTVFVVANKTDALRNPVQQTQEVAKFCAANGVTFHLTSTKEPATVEGLFRDVAAKLCLRDHVPRTHAVLKVMLVGDRNVGKSSLVERFTLGTYSQSKAVAEATRVVPTIKMEAERREFEVKLLDPSGKEEVASCMAIADAFVVIYDLNEKDVHKSVLKWLKEIKKKAQEHALIAVVGNKLDLMVGPCYGNISVSQLAAEQKLIHKVVSARNGFGVSALFTTLVQGVVERGLEHLLAASNDTPPRSSTSSTTPGCLIF